MGAMSRVAAKAQRGVPAKQVQHAMEDVLAVWRDEPISRNDLRERLEIVQEEVDGGILAAEEYIAVAETDAQVRAAEAQFDALKAIRSVVNRELAEMRYLL